MSHGGARRGAGRKPAPHKALNIRLPLATSEAVEKAASEDGITVSAWVRKAIQDRLEHGEFQARDKI